MNMPTPHAGSHEMDHAPHLDDPAKQSEHLALLDLVPHNAATHVAVKNGSWFDATTWANGQVPGNDARVLIPEGMTVDYDGISNASLFTLRVDGQLAFATDEDTQMKLDTFVVSPSGTLTMGSELNPVQADVKTRILIADNGAIDTAWDPQQLSRGLVSHGTVEVHGQAKTSHLKVSFDPAAGDKTLVLESAPENWQVGDRIVLTGTRYVPYEIVSGEGWTYQGTEDEERTITAIDGDRITLDRPLDYDHDTPEDDLKAYVANQSRNIVIATENAEALPANQRGHVMFMHSDNVDVRYAEFHELGRTDKSKLLDDFVTEDDRFHKRVLDDDGNPIPGDRTNIRGRYALHLHRTGVNGDETPAVLVGNSVDGSPGWGIVQHDSYAVLENNLSYNVTGAGFVSETGNEIGAWRNNISIRNEGGRKENEKSGVNNQDLGFAGHGFWLQGRLVENQDNVAAGNRGSGIFYFHRGIDQLKVDADNLPLEDWAKGQDQVGVDTPPITGFENNEVFASGNGLKVIKNFQSQEHDGRTLLDGFTAWEVAEGTELQYTAHYTLKDFTLIGGETVKRDWVNDGMHLAQNTEDIVFDTLRTEGFERGIKLDKKLAGQQDAARDWGYVFVDTQLANNQQDFVNVDPAFDRFLTRADVEPGRLSFDLDAASSDFVVKGSDKGFYASIVGTKTDSLGSIDLPFGSEELGYTYEGVRDLAREGYYTLPDGSRGVVVDEYISDRLTGDLRKYSYVITFEGAFWTNNAPDLGPLDPKQVEGASAIIDFDDIAFNHPSFVDDVPDSGNPSPSPNPEPTPVPEPEPTPIPDPEPTPVPDADSVIGEYGTLAIDHTWQTIQLDDTYENPVVIVSDPTFEGSDPVAVRVRNVTPKTFELRLQEPNYKDGWHTKESVSYVVMEAGDWTLADGTRIAAGTRNSSRLTSKGFDAIDLKGFQSAPTVLSQVQTFNGGDWVTTRTTESSAKGFELAMQEEEALNQSGHARETLGWVAIDQGAASDGDTLLQAKTTGQSYSDDRSTVKFEEGFDITPSVIAKLGSFAGSDTANLRLDDITPTSFGVGVYEEQSLDTELGHVDEAVSFLALTGKSGTLTGIAASVGQR